MVVAVSLLRRARHYTRTYVDVPRYRYGGSYGRDYVYPFVRNQVLLTQMDFSFRVAHLEETNDPESHDNPAGTMDHEPKIDGGSRPLHVSHRSTDQSVTWVVIEVR